MIGWASERELPVVTVGLGSNVLAPDEGLDALVLRLDGELATVAIDGDLLVAGGGATNAVCLHRHERPASAASNSPARSPALPAAASG